MTQRQLVERAKEIIANGCGCDRWCERYGAYDEHCGCEEDAEAIIALVRGNGEVMAGSQEG